MSNPSFYRLSQVTETLLYTSIFIPSVKHLQHFKYFYQLFYAITVMSQKNQVYNTANINLKVGPLHV
jgi:hypothetical protein